MKCAVLAAALLVCAFAAGAAEPSWNDIVAAANGEGLVLVHGGPGKLYSEVMTEGFRAAYPGIKIDFNGASGRDAIPKIMREREAGIYNLDVYVGGTPSILQALLPAGAFAPLRPALVAPEVQDDKAWYGGLFGAWMDKAGAHVLGFEATVSAVLVVNWDFVSHDDLKTYDDLMKPQFAGKIVWDDPRLPGQGVASAQTLLINFGADYLKRLYAGQKIVYVANPRQNAEWVVRGQYPIGIATAFEELAPFQQQGLGKAIAVFDAKLEHPTVGPGFGTVSLMDKAPHPNAAKVYINWLLSRAGQTDWGKTGHNSRRLDVPHARPELFPVPGTRYVDDQNEENIPSREEAAGLAKQLIPISQ
ncbi:MAG TPA: ABC transporter substrate-binding protein [Stellaceae bacterium]|nr:ABC transporter substrate-binding protein [Stellaceae bacterium]